MSTFDRESHYFSGQGVVMIGERDTVTGKAAGLIPVANVSALSLTGEEDVEQHKESQSGARGIDRRISTELRCGVAMTMESFIAENLAIATRGSYSFFKSASVTNEAVKLFIGAVVAVGKMKLSAVAVEDGATVFTAFVDDATPYDYKLNAEAGSVQFNDGSVTLLANMAAAGTALAGAGVTVGTTTTLTFAATPATATVGKKCAIQGVAGADAALLNKKSFTILSKTGTTVVIDADTSGKTITIGTGLVAFDSDALQVDYTYEAQYRVDALTEGSRERFLRFEGLNTADSNRPVVVEIYKFQTDVLAELALINESIQGFELQGSALADSLQTSGSKYYRIMTTR